MSHPSECFSFEVKCLLDHRDCSFPSKLQQIECCCGLCRDRTCTRLVAAEAAAAAAAVAAAADAPLTKKEAWMVAVAVAADNPERVAFIPANTAVRWIPH